MPMSKIILFIIGYERNVHHLLCCTTFTQQSVSNGSSAGDMRTGSWKYFGN